MLAVVLITMLLNGHICQVHKLIVHLCYLGAVLDVAEACKTKLRHIHLQQEQATSISKGQVGSEVEHSFEIYIGAVFFFLLLELGPIA